MDRVVIAPRMATFGLGALTFFAVGGLAIGALMLVGAEAVARQGAGSATAVRVGGAAALAIGLAVLVGALRQWPAIATIVRDADGWILVDRLGRAHGVDAGATVELALRCRRVVFTWGAAPRIRDVVDGTLAVGGRRHRLAPSGPVTYATVLTSLGARGGPPARGHRARYTVRAG